MKLTTREIILCGLFAALVSIFAQISIPLPFTTVPLTLQIFGIAITGLILGSKCAFISTLIYLILGGIGVPVFAQFSAGIGVLFGPTGGYLLAYPLMAFIIGYIKEKSNYINCNKHDYWFSSCICTRYSNVLFSYWKYNNK